MRDVQVIFFCCCQIAGETDTAWSFGDNDEDIQRFITTSDSDHNEGNSKCTFVKSPAGYGIFSGTLDSTVPLQGNIKRTGYCNITSLRAMVGPFDFCFNFIFIIKIRMFQSTEIVSTSIVLWLERIQCVGVTNQRRWTTVHAQYLVRRIFRCELERYVPIYFVHTRWTTLATHQSEWNNSFACSIHFVCLIVCVFRFQIPFSKFFLSAKGSIQDKQCELVPSRVSRFGITSAGLKDQDGSFSLEIDYIGLENDPSHTEEFAYEMYQVPKFIVGNG